MVQRKFFLVMTGHAILSNFNKWWSKLSLGLQILLWKPQIFFFPVQTFIGYFALGGVVLASRLLFPAKSAAPAAPALAAVEAAEQPNQKAEEFALAA